jgi:hypothetical protein
VVREGVREKSVKRTPKKAETTPAPPPASAPDEKGRVIGPGVVKRPKRAPGEEAAAGGAPIPYTPSEQVFRRKK